MKKILIALIATTMVLSTLVFLTSCSDNNTTFLEEVLELVDNVLDGTVCVSVAAPTMIEFSQRSLEEVENEDFARLVMDMNRSIGNIANFRNTWRLHNSIGDSESLPSIEILEIYIQGALTQRNEIANAIGNSSRTTWYAGLVELITEV